MKIKLHNLDRLQNCYDALYSAKLYPHGPYGIGRDIYLALEKNTGPEGETLRQSDVDWLLDECAERLAS